ncbi:MAG: methyltransferase domain-containing protein [Proteobacteria bacterium]|nr:methyltransferase domain-containing protein [Pseudomonadota bacterium]
MEYFYLGIHKLKLANGPGKYKITEDALWLFGVLPLDKTSYLDVGCGSGILSLLLSKKRPDAKIKSIDIQKELIDQALKHSEINKTQNIEFKQEDVFNLTEEGSFDCVFSNPPFFDLKKTQSSADSIRSVAHFQPDMISFIKKLLKLVKPDGYICFLAHVSTRQSVLSLLRGRFFTTEIELKTSKNNRGKRFVYVVQNKESEHFEQLSVNCFEEDLRKKILFEQKTLYKYNSVC